MPSMDSKSSCYSSSGSSTSSLSSPRVLINDLIQNQATRIIKSPGQSHISVTRYKTELCRPFTETGKCKYGEKCQFSHGTKELRVLARHPKYKTEYCRTFHTAGYCPYGPRCHFIHDVHETRTVLNANEQTLRRHSDARTYSSTQKSTTRNRINSDYTIHSDQSYEFSNFPFTFEDLNRALELYNMQDILEVDQQQSDSLVSSPLDNTFTRRTFSSSSSSNSSLTPQYF